MDMKELRGQTPDELRAGLKELLKEQFNLRMQQGSGQTPRSHLIQKVRKDIARVKTVINEKRKAGE
jgi:large subunit ribosomal protein L29